MLMPTVKPAPVGGCGYRGVPGACNPSYLDLCNHMKNREPITVVGPDHLGHTGYVVAIAMEDGSGHNWIVTLSNGGKKEDVFIKAN